jgi:hypothetical protein
MKYTIKICPWKNGQGWQEHDIADRHGKTIADVFSEFNKLELLPPKATAVDLEKEGVDYSLELYKAEDKIAEFWYSEFLRNGVVVGNVKYSIKKTTNKKNFFDWLDGLLKEEYKTDKFRTAAWIEAQEKDASGTSYELEARYTLLGRPYLYRLS